MPAVAAKPVQTLHEHTVALEAAITVALANPRKGVVHKLRSQTRRIEAQLLLLDQLKGLPPHRTEEAKLRRELKLLRRAAGHVRDLDVHAEHLKHLQQNEGTPELQADFLKRREKLAADLVALLTARQTKLSAALEALHQALKPADKLTLPVADLLAHAHALFAASLPAKRNFARLSEDHLHDIRKAAKLSRYLAESSPRSKRALAEGATYESLQESGGHWHDALVLAALAKKRLGKSHPLTQHLRSLRTRHYNSFLAALEAIPAEPRS